MDTNRLKRLDKQINSHLRNEPSLIGPMFLLKIEILNQYEKYFNDEIRSLLKETMDVYPRLYNAKEDTHDESVYSTMRFNVTNAIGLLIEIIEESDQ